MTNSTYDCLCTRHAIKQILGDAVDVLHFDDAWYPTRISRVFTWLPRHFLASVRRAQRMLITFATRSPPQAAGGAYHNRPMIHVLAQ